MTRSLLPFFSYFGSKCRLAPSYQEPLHDQIIEPFAGGAGYSLNYPDRQIILCDKDPVIANLWKYLINVSETEILNLPINIWHVNELGPSIPEEARHLIGFWFNPASTGPRNQRTKWSVNRVGLKQWTDKVKFRIASQLKYIRHWQVQEGDYRDLENIKATWFIDPPYQNPGCHYVCSSKDIDFAELGEWCKSRNGQVIVCEQKGADWLPFRYFQSCRGSRYESTEVVWYNNFQVTREKQLM